MAKNTVNAIFNVKKNLYQDFPKINGVEYFDLERRHMHYGKIDFDGDAVYLDTGPNLSAVFSGPKETHFACNFVSEAFNDMRLNIGKARDSNLINNRGVYSTKLRVKKSQTYGDLPFSYNVHLNKIYTNFVNNYLSIDRRAEQIKNYKDFKDNVPIYTYEELEKYIGLIRKGERDILWPGKIKRFAISSGTSNGKSKFIPISKECLRSCHYKSGKKTFSSIT